LVSFLGGEIIGLFDGLLRALPYSHGVWSALPLRVFFFLSLWLRPGISS
jgi:hypothetical protein